MLDRLKIDLGISGTIYDDRLDQLLTAAENMITEEGVTLDTTAERDMQLVIMYAAWLWRRRDTMESMPRMVRYCLNNRLMAEKAADDD